MGGSCYLCPQQLFSCIPGGAKKVILFEAGRSISVISHLSQTPTSSQRPSWVSLSLGVCGKPTTIEDYWLPLVLQKLCFKYTHVWRRSEDGRYTLINTKDCLSQSKSPRTRHHDRWLFCSAILAILSYPWMLAVFRHTLKDTEICHSQLDCPRTRHHDRWVLVLQYWLFYWI